MFDVAPSEFLIVALVALIVIGPKDLPKAMRVLGYWVGKARGVARQFRSGFDDMVREAELAEMEKKWASENARILAEHPNTETSAEAPALPPPDVAERTPAEPDLFTDAVMVEKPAIVPGEEPPAVDGKPVS